jgi:hypothetical protein
MYQKEEKSMNDTQNYTTTKEENALASEFEPLTMYAKPDDLNSQKWLHAPLATQL